MGVVWRGGTETHDFAMVEPNKVILLLEHTMLPTLSNLKVHRHAGLWPEEASRMSRNICRHT